MRIGTRIVLWCIPLVFLTIAFWHYYGLSGTLSIHHSFDTLSPLVNDPVPSVRVGRRNGFPYIINDPVYIDVRMPRHFNSITVQPIIENPDKVLIKFGAQLAASTPSPLQGEGKGEVIDWRFDLRPFTPSESFTFDVSTLALRNRKLRFIISAPALRDGVSEGIVLKSIDIIFTGTSLWGKIFSK